MYKGEKEGNCQAMVYIWLLFCKFDEVYMLVNATECLIAFMSVQICINLINEMFLMRLI